MRTRIIWTLLLTLMLGTATQAVPVRAAISISVSPSIVEVSGKAGATGAVELNVSNGGDESFDVAITIGPYDEVDPGLSVPTWLTVDHTSLHADPGGRASIHVSIAIPKGELTGSRYATVAISTAPPDGQGNSTAISGKLVVPFLITVDGKGKLSRKAEIERYAPVIELDGRLGFRAELSNGGNTHWKGSGTNVISKTDGSTYGTLDFDPSTVFPNGTWVLSTTSTLPIEPGAKYKASIEVNFGSKKPKKAETEFTFTPQLSVAGSVCENLDKGPTVSASLINDGDLGIIGVVNMFVVAQDGPDGGQTGTLGPETAWPKDTTVVDADLGNRLPSGDYKLIIQVQTGASADPIVQEIPFSIGGTGPNVAPVCPQPESTPGT
jgi:hypothetical protein